MTFEITFCKIFKNRLSEQNNGIVEFNKNQSTKITNNFWVKILSSGEISSTINIYICKAATLKLETWFALLSK